MKWGDNRGRSSVWKPNFRSRTSENMTQIRCIINIEAGTRNPISEGISALLALLGEVEITLATCKQAESAIEIRETRRGEDTCVKLEIRTTTPRKSDLSNTGTWELGGWEHGM